MALLDDLRKAANDALAAGAMAARQEGVALASDFETLLKPNLEDIVVQIAAITEARIADTISADLAQANLRQQLDSIEDLAVAETELVLLAIQNILNAIIDALKAVVNAASSKAIGIALL